MENNMLKPYNEKHNIINANDYIYLNKREKSIKQFLEETYCENMSTEKGNVWRNVIDSGILENSLFR